MANAPLPDPIPAGSASWLGATSLSLGVIGLGLSWLPPFSIIISAVGFVCGVVALVRPAGRRTYSRWFALGGVGLCLLAAGLCAFLMPGWQHHPWPLGGP